MTQSDHTFQHATTADLQPDWLIRIQIRANVFHHICLVISYNRLWNGPLESMLKLLDWYPTIFQHIEIWTKWQHFAGNNFKCFFLNKDCWILCGIYIYLGNQYLLHNTRYRTRPLQMGKNKHKNNTIKTIQSCLYITWYQHGSCSPSKTHQCIASNKRDDKVLVQETTKQFVGL